ncbi:MAG: alpha/beta hydrolase [Deltaproteobacteria bacterium]|nr:alpha/beta hydrolase [Deltaproteobacteria bacterium]
MITALSLLLACNPATDTGPVADDTGIPDEITETATGAVDALIAGDRELASTLQELAWAEGWPLLTDRGTMFFIAEGGGDWSVAGDFNGWAPAPMEHGEGFSWLEVEIAEPAGVGYKFVRDDAWSADPWSRSYTWDDNGRMSYVRAPTALPHLELWPAMRGAGLGPRSVRVYVPAGEGPWPVLYMHDGQNLFDPGAFWGGWRMQEALEEASGEVLVVGIDNTEARMDEYVHAEDQLEALYGGLGDEYAAFVQEELRPFIEEQYPTEGPTGVMGSSLGGLISLSIADLYPGAYDFAGSLSGTLGWGRFGLDNPTVQELYLAAGVRETVLYVDSGGDDGGDGCTDPDGDGFFEDDPNGADNYCESRQFVDAMADQGYTWEQDLFHWWQPQAEHNEAEWAARVDRPLEIFLSLR